MTENNRRARYYEVTAAGERQLERERAEWSRSSTAVEWVLGVERGCGVRGLREWQGRLRGVVRRARDEAEMDEEMRFHLEMEAERLEREEGLAPAEARRRARLAFGGVEGHREAVRDARGLGWVEDAGRDLRFAARSLRRAPGFSAVAVLTLALGIGGNTAIFSVVDGVLLRPLPYRDPGRLVAVDAGMGVLGELLALRGRVPALAGVEGYSAREATLTGGGEAVRVESAAVTPGLFGLVGAAPALGRAFLPEEDEAGRDAVVVLSHALWRQRYGGDPGVVGREIEVDGARRTWWG